jgi:DNA-binding response OmpR family regulator
MSGLVEQVVFCPACSGRFQAGVALPKDRPVVFLCSQCGGANVVDVNAVPVDVDAAAAAWGDAQRPRVVVGHELPAAARAIADALRRGGYAPVCVRSGAHVLAACDPAMPSPVVAVVLDVAVPDVLAFEIIESLRANERTAALPVVLLASVYERTRYKRRPNRLYGADAYLELHHVPDRLVEVVSGLLAHEAVSDGRVQSPVERARAVRFRGGAAPDDRETSRALARRLLSDVALYHGDEIAQGIRRGRPFAELADAVDAARDLHVRAGGAATDFDDELALFSSRLSEREASRA